MNENYKKLTPIASSIKVLVTSGVRGDTRRYRAFHLVEQLQLYGVEARFIHLTDVGFKKVLASQFWDVVVLHRTPYPVYLGSIVEQLKKKGTLLLTDFDDLLFDPAMFQFINSPDFADAVRSSLYQETMRNTQMMLACSNAAMASTGYLAEQICRLDKPAWVHRNAFSLEMLKISTEVLSAGHSPDNQRTVIGYASGTPTHNHDFEMIRPMLIRIMQKYPHVELRIIGPLDLGDGWRGVLDRVQRLKLVPWRRLPWLLNEFDINLAPLVMDNPFSQSKSEIKYMEAAMVGVPTIASPTDAFRHAIRSQENGFLASTQEEWLETLSTLIEDRLLRERAGQTALDLVMEQYHPATRAGELAGQLEEICQSLQGKSLWGANKVTQEQIEARMQKAVHESGRLLEQHERGPSYLQMGLFHLRTDGIKRTLQFVWVFFRRMISPVIPYKKGNA